MTESTADRQKMFKELSTAKNADAMDFLLTRANPKPNETFSAEYLADFESAVNTFINARLVYHWKDRPKTEPGPHLLKVEVKVTIDDIHRTPGDEERPWFVIDGTKRVLDA